MARDGTARGGQRNGSGRRSRAKSEMILEGRMEPAELDAGDELEGLDMPPVKDWMTARQKNGEELCARETYEDTYRWLHRMHCDRIVSPLLVERYAMSVARWVQCEKAISDFGMLAKHPTTGAAIASPYVSMSREYMKQVNQCWYPIQQLVKENSTEVYQGASPQDDLMERLLTSRR